MKEVPKGTKGTGSNQHKVAENHGGVTFSKRDQLEQAGFSRNQQSQYQRMADNPE